jgi:hypothetical protein
MRNNLEIEINIIIFSGYPESEPEVKNFVCTK